MDDWESGLVANLAEIDLDHIDEFFNEEELFDEEIMMEGERDDGVLLTEEQVQIGEQNNDDIRMASSNNMNLDENDERLEEPVNNDNNSNNQEDFVEPKNISEDYKAKWAKIVSPLTFFKKYAPNPNPEVDYYLKVLKPAIDENKPILATYCRSLKPQQRNSRKKGVSLSNMQHRRDSDQRKQDIMDIVAKEAKESRRVLSEKRRSLNENVSNVEVVIQSMQNHPIMNELKYEHESLKNIRNTQINNFVFEFEEILCKNPREILDLHERYTHDEIRESEKDKKKQIKNSHLAKNKSFVKDYMKFGEDMRSAAIDKERIKLVDWLNGQYRTLNEKINVMETSL